MTFDGPDNDEAGQALQLKAAYWARDGYTVIDPGDGLDSGSYAVTVDSGDLNSGDTLSVGSADDEVLFDGSVESLTESASVGVSGVSAEQNGAERYRYDVIWADDNGDVQSTEGDIVTLDSVEDANNLTRFERYKAAIPEPDTTPSVVIAAIVVNSDDESVGASQLRDYRVDANSTFNDVTAEDVNAKDVTADTASVDDITADTADLTTATIDESTHDEITNQKYLETPEVVSDAGSSQDIDLADSNQYKITLTEDCDISFSNFENGASVTLYIEQDGSGGHSVTWPTILWPDGEEPTPNDGGDEIDRFVFDQIDGDIYGSRAGVVFS